MYKGQSRFRGRVKTHSALPRRAESLIFRGIGSIDFSSKPLTTPRKSRPRQPVSRYLACAPDWRTRFGLAPAYAAFIKIVANAGGLVYRNACKPDSFQNLVVCFGNRPVGLRKIEL